MLSSDSQWIPRLGWLVAVGTRLGLSENAVLGLIWWLLLLGGLLLLAGLFSRTAAITTALLHLCSVKSIGSLTYGFDNFSTIGLFYLAVGPLPDRLALDCVLRDWRRKDAELHGFFRNILRIHLSMAYLFGGITKCAGIGWWNGENLWRAMIRPPFNVIPADVIVAWRWLLPVAGVAVCLLETSYPIFIWPNRTRPYWLAAILAMHVVIGLVLGLYLFAFVMIVLNLAAFGAWPARENPGPRLRSTPGGESATMR
jgi:hypothetical protein